MSNATIAFIGAGNLTHALVAGLINDQYNPQKIWVTNPSPAKLDALRQQFGIQTTENNRQAVLAADVVVLAVKPVHIHALCREIKSEVLQRQPLIISVAVGATTALIEKWLEGYPAIVRTMPNTPARVGAGATGLYAGPAVNTLQKNLAEIIFRAVGITLWVEDEQQIDSVCALSGCGPGYTFLMMEAIESAAQQQGLSAQMSRLLVAETFLGAARLALESNCTLAELRRQVTSPKGPTEKIIQILEQGGIRRLIDEALAAAMQRMAEIAEELAAK